MTKQEFDEMAALVVRLRKDVELHADALKQSNAQCAEYLRQNEKLQARLTLESETNARGLAEAENSVAFYRLAADTVDRLLETILQCGADESDDIGGFIKRTAAERDALHSELVNVRAALAATTEQRDSLKRTLDEWSDADTKPHERIELPTVPDDLEFRAGIPTPEMLAVCSWWEVQGSADVICFKNKDQRPVVWRSLRGDASWQYEDCPQPLKPSKRTWRQLDALLADPPSAVISDHAMPPLRMGLVSAGGSVYIHDDVADHVVPPVLPMCMTCHGCESVLYPSPAGDYLCCGNVRCTRSNTKHWHSGCTIGPYAGPCKSTTPVRHE